MVFWNARNTKPIKKCGASTRRERALEPYLNVKVSRPCLSLPLSLCACVCLFVCVCFCLVRNAGTTGSASHQTESRQQKQHSNEEEEEGEERASERRVGAEREPMSMLRCRAQAQRCDAAAAATRCFVSFLSLGMLKLCFRSLLCLLRTPTYTSHTQTHTHMCSAQSPKIPIINA